MRIAKVAVCLTLIVLLVGITGCAAHMHKVGSGAAGTDKVQQRQWYVLFGLVPINTVDSQAMAGGAANYDIKTEQSFLDIVINIFTSVVSVNSRTVTVTK